MKFAQSKMTEKTAKKILGCTLYSTDDSNINSYKSITDYSITLARFKNAFENSTQ